ncbi:MAG: phage protein gp10 family [Xanthobacteraceae bacterium]|jgi:HK97 gp10 family phage protein|nr:phage protein gp10 family [Xanthobacteraceae bacterium]
MVGKLRYSVSGLKELSAGLSDLSKAVQKGVLKRTLLKTGKPMAAKAAQLAPKDTHDLENSIILAAKTIAEMDEGLKAYGAVLRSGGSKAAATSALRAARRAGGTSDTFAEVYVGPARGSKRRAIKAIVQELGSATQAPQPYLRPALAQTQGAVLDGIGRELGTEIEKAARRAAKRKAKKGGA